MRAEILKEHGHSVVVFHSPLEATRCDLSMFNLAILDFEMPGYYSVEDDPADSSAATGTFTLRVGVGREMPSFFIL
jgi:hypothetical protein